MEEIKAPKKERKFLKAMGDIALTLLRDLLLGVGKKVINKVGNKRQGLAIALVMVAGVSYAAVDSIPYPITGNKQKLGWQTSGNGLVYRGTAADTVTKPSNYTNKDIKAYLLVDTVNNVMYSYIASKGGWKFNNSDTVIIQGATMPFDSITFNTAKDGTVGVGEVEYNDTQGSLIQGLKGGNVTNVIGQQLHQRVNNRTGATLNKGDVVYLSGSQGNRITVAKAIATSDPTSANTFGIVAESIADNQSGYVITEGLITNLNTSALTQDSAVYLSGTTAGALTSTKPQAPIHGVYIGVCVKTNAGSGEVFVKIRNGQELDELHDVQITSPVDKASLYYKSSEGLWRDTTAALLVSDTASMLTPYFRDADTTSLNLTSRFAAKLNISDTASMLTNYLRTGVAASTYQPILVSGTNIKTVNSNSLLGSGNISVGTITGSGSNLYFPIFTSSLNITQSLLRWNGTATPNSILYNDYNSNQLIGALTVGGTLGVTGTISGSSKITIAGKSEFGNIGVGADTMTVNGFLNLKGIYIHNNSLNRIVGFTTSNNLLSEIELGNMLSLDYTSPPAKNTLNIKSASTTQVGVVDISSQSFFGNKTFTSNITLENDVDNRQGYLRRGYVTITNATYTVADNVTWIICNRSGGTITITLPDALNNDGRELHIKNITTNSVISNATNVVELADNAATTAILSASKDGGWATLVSNGSNWVIMQAN